MSRTFATVILMTNTNSTFPAEALERLITEQADAIAGQAEALATGSVIGPDIAAAKRLIQNAETLLAYIEARAK